MRESLEILISSAEDPALTKHPAVRHVRGRFAEPEEAIEALGSPR